MLAAPASASPASIAPLGIPVRPRERTLLKKSLVLISLLLLAALALAACGGGGSSSDSEAEAAIEKTIESSATASDPAKCTKYQTPAFNEQETGAKGKEATELCEQQASEQQEAVEKVTVSNIKVDGETATAEADLTGSALNDQVVELELAEEGGEWKLNQFLALTKFDAKELSEGFEKGLIKQGELPASQIKCFAEGIAEFSKGEAEALAFEGDVKPLEELGCE
jgi:hypothetical protein